MINENDCGTHQLQNKGHTFIALLPQAQVDVRDVAARNKSVREVRNLEDVWLDLGDVIRVVTEDPGQGGLTNLGQLCRCEYPWVLVPETATAEHEESRLTLEELLPVRY